MFLRVTGWPWSDYRHRTFHNHCRGNLNSHRGLCSGKRSHLLITLEKKPKKKYQNKSQFISDWPPLWSSDQNSWLQSQRSGSDSRRYQIFCEVVGLERGPPSLVSTTEELLGRNSRDSGLEIREYGRGDPLRRPRDTLYPQRFALTSPTSGGRSVGIVRLRTKATEFFHSRNKATVPYVLPACRAHILTADVLTRPRLESSLRPVLV
jgi:hypothetical protein